MVPKIVKDVPIEVLNANVGKVVRRYCWDSTANEECWLACMWYSLCGGPKLMLRSLCQSERRVYVCPEARVYYRYQLRDKNGNARAFTVNRKSLNTSPLSNVLTSIWTPETELAKQYTHKCIVRQNRKLYIVHYSHTTIAEIYALEFPSVHPG